jgi:beta-lactamase class A
MAGSVTAASLVARPAVGAGAPDDLIDQLADLERAAACRLGVAILDTETGRRWAYRADERFPMCSTFKLLACAAVLAEVDRGQEDLNRRIRFEPSDVVTYSPVTKDLAGSDGMTLAQICSAAMTQSDNTAGNLILQSLGGPGAVTAFARSLGDVATRLDRIETALNEAKPDDPRDTTTPAAMTANLHALVADDTLSARSREQLIAWLVANRTGDAKLRAGLPKDWRVGDKTGGGDWGTMNDVAVIWPSGRGPVLASVYMTETTTSFEDRNAAFAKIGLALPGALLV